MSRGGIRINAAISDDANIDLGVHDRRVEDVYKEGIDRKVLNKHLQVVRKMYCYCGTEDY